MSDDNKLSKDIEQALTWCRDARDILKIKREEWYKRDQKMAEFDKLDKYLEKVKTGLSDLDKVKHKDKQKQEEQRNIYERFANEFIKHAKLGIEAKKKDNLELSKLLIDQLVVLDLEIRTALGKKNTSGENIEELKKALAEKRLEKYNTALNKAEQIRTALAKRTHEMHVFTGEVPNYIREARLKFSSGDLAGALELLGEVPGEDTLQRDRYQTYCKYRNSLSWAEHYNQELQQFDRMRGTTVSEQVILLIGNAKHEADAKFGYGAASDMLEKVKELYKKTIGNLTGNDLDAFNEFNKARKKFEESYEEARKLIGNNLSLRGMLVDGPVKTFMTEAQKTLDLARKAADETTNPVTIKHAEELLKVVEEKVKLAIAASEQAKEKSKRELEEMKQWLAMLDLAEKKLKEISQLRGTEREQSDLASLIEKAKKELKPIDGKSVEQSLLVAGYPEAVKVLSPYTNLVEEAKKHHTEALKDDFPKSVEEALLGIRNAFQALDPHVSKIFADVQLDQLDVIKENIRLNLYKAKNDNPPTSDKAEKLAVEQCELFQDYLEDEFDRQTKAKSEALSKLDEYYRERKKLLEAGMPIQMLAVAERLANAASNGDIVDREWDRALRNLETALEIAAEVAKDFEQHAKAWNEKEERIALFKETAKSLLSWPPIMGPARSLLDECLGLEDMFLRTFDIPACLQEFDDLKLERSYESLLSDKQKMGVPDQKDAELFLGKVKEGTLKVRARVDEVANGALAKLEKHLTKVADPRVNSLRATLERVASEWETYSFKPDTDLAKIEKKIEESLKKLDQVETLAKKIVGDPKLLNSLVEQMKSEENQRHAEELPVFVRDQIDRLDDPKTAEMYRQTLDGLERRALSGGKGAIEGLEKLRDQVLEDLSSQRKAAQSVFDGALKRAEKLRESLFEIKGRHKEFQLYQVQLEKDLLDAKTMLASGDPDLLEAAQQMLAELERRVAEVDPQQRKKDGPRYSAARDRHTKICKMLGSTEVRGGEIVVENRLPNTYKRLCEAVNTQWAKCMKMGPQEAYDALNDVERQVTAAYQKALELNDEHTRYKLRVEKFQKDWAKVKEVTRTRATEKSGSLQNYIDSRLSDADDLRHTETGMDAAYRILAELEDRMRQLLEIPDPGDMREKLKDMNAECFKEQEYIRDMARQFRVELEHFKEVVLKNAKQQIETNFEQQLILKADRDDSLKILDNLKNQASSASKIAKPYLANLEKLPHERKGADKAPSLEKARADLITARDLLKKGKVAADRLANATSTTNVHVTAKENMSKLQDYWANQAKQFASTLREFSEAVFKEVGGMTPENSNMTEENILDLKKHSDEVGKLVEQAAVRFSLSAFKRPLDILGDLKADENERLAARETALRTMREYRDDVLNHPVLRKLTDKKNPLHRPKLLAATGYVRAALKRIEAGALTGV